MEKLTSTSIVKELESRKRELRQFGVHKIGLFGSFIHAEAGSKSDIDLLVVFEHPTFDNYMDLKFYLERIFKRKVDLVLEDSLKPSLQYVREEAVYAKVA